MWFCMSKAESGTRKEMKVWSIQIRGLNDLFLCKIFLKQVQFLINSLVVCYFWRLMSFWYLLFHFSLNFCRFSIPLPFFMWGVASIFMSFSCVVLSCNNPHFQAFNYYILCLLITNSSHILYIYIYIYIYIYLNTT